MKTQQVLKNYPVVFKSVAEDDPAGTFEALVAVFGNVDRAGDVIQKGAFAESIARGFPSVIWSHDWLTPPIGVVNAVQETDEGLVVKGRLFVDEGIELAKHVHVAMTALGGDGKPALKEWSFGANVVEASEEVQDEEAVFVLTKLDLIEIGPCLKGMNPATQTLAAKSNEAITRSDAETVTEEVDGNTAETNEPSAEGLTPAEHAELISGLLF